MTGFAAKVASMVWLAATLGKVNVGTTPTEAPSTSTSEMLKPLLGVMLKVRLAPADTWTDPDGEIVPPVPAIAVMMLTDRVRTNVPESKKKPFEKIV